MIGAVAGAVFYVTRSAAKPHASVAQVKTAKAAQPEWNVTSVDSNYTFSFSGDGVLRLDVMIDDEEPLNISSLAGLADVPRGWVANVTVRMIDGVGPAFVTPFPNEIDAQELSTSRDDLGYPFSLHNCGADIDPAMGLRIQTSKPGRYSFVIEPVLTPVGC